MYTGTYSPEDNKLRLYASERLPKDLYERVKAAGYKWAPKQGFFVAPMWTPERADLLTELCGEIGDEDTSLVQRAEERADRFEGYSDKREAEAERKHDAVTSLAGSIPLGQPILVGHHSERHARRDAEKIQNGMRKAIQLWETSKYWADRAEGALRHAKYKELPAVRARRIKGIEADLRKVEKDNAQSAKLQKLWEECTDLKVAHLIASRTEAGYLPCCPNPVEGLSNQWLKPSDVLPFEDRSDWAKAKYPTWTLDQVKARAAECYPANIARRQRWVDHYKNRLTYDRAMLAAGGGLTGEKFNYEIGGQVLRRGQWLRVRKINRKDGAVFSIGVIGHFESTVPVEDVQDYRPPTPEAAEAAEAVKKATKLPPLCNYPGEGFQQMSKKEWDERRKWTDVPTTKAIASNEKYDKHRVRVVTTGSFRMAFVYLTDLKPTLPPPPTEKPAAELLGVERAYPGTPRAVIEAAEVKEKAEKFAALKTAAEAGVQVVSANQLFPTPPEVAQRVMELACIDPGMRVLEPSAGTGNLIAALPKGVNVVAVEINQDVFRCLSRSGVLPIGAHLIRADFLECLPARDGCHRDIGTFDRIVMNPPFEDAVDIKHVRHALQFLKPGGSLVAIVANGPRQRNSFMEECDYWEDLPAGSFASSGTNVNAAIVVFSKPEGSGEE